MRPLPERFECRPKLVIEFGEAIGALGGLEKHPSVDEVRNLVARTLDGISSVHRLSSRKPGSRIVFLASHQAHFHGRKPVPVECEPIAASKRAGKYGLRDSIPDFNSRGIELVVVSGDMIDGTTVVTLLERRNPDAVAARTACGALPTVAEFATAVVAACVDAIERSGHVVYVGGADYLEQ
ncbi:hypothetical protein QM797_20750 [Rhodococcus sp. IEGM 1381]|uniref:hypothetical protein n=1 Tax=Rhodococcus sp. IEGM 1381 TaxID=3047085 RepID=UPI0024B82E1B|nr:hypothetical protein [Rhodococcus sp. IEGM 1381]MDI9897156.1 hypothetical protein [Rhodococcus sp. IEGM 1381]